MRPYIALCFLISPLLCAQDSRELINEGVAAFRSANYQKALELFQRAVGHDPGSVNAHLYLGTTYMSLWVPGARTPENEEQARLAESEFKRVLEMDAINKTAIASLASLAYNSKNFDEAIEWNKRMLTVDPANKEAYYSLGVIAWGKWYGPYIGARAEVLMKPEDPGPLPDPQRAALKHQYAGMIEDGIANLNHALMVDPHYDDAMAYINLLIRERADLADSKQQWAAEVAIADDWVQKALAEKKLKASSAQGYASLPPPPPPAPSGGGGGGSRTPERIRVSGNVQAANLVTKADAVYPPLAAQARIAGIVRFTVFLNRDGTVQNLQLISGHPLLVAAARDAVSKYVYRVTLLNGEPVEVITSVDVTFP